MSEPKWTPGPWRAVEPSDRLPYWNIWDTNDRGFDVWVCTLKSNAAPIEEEPNAHLIAAAPTLYAELDALVLVISSPYGDDEYDRFAQDFGMFDFDYTDRLWARVLAARAALREARGEEPDE